ncbi:MAG: radical SAM protein [Dictyoglomus sp.]|nr:radical SAM protein [Dictyoglomus sp.]MCX7942352.1 radical SAM protein [Dictyoglomaceae bacterium]MDW8188444.1 radical SAM protein [Dictyoglomus sp.]
MSWNFKKRIREILEKERGYKLSKRGGDVSVLLIFPNKYSLSLSNLGYLTIYKLFNEQKGILCERAFIPDDFPENSDFPLYSLESQRLGRDFDLWAFSLSFELDYFNVIKILESQKIPLFSNDRMENYPLIIAGGIAISSNPEPLADVFDLIFIGEGENFIEKFSEKLINKKIYNWNKKRFLEEVSEINGVYIPRFSTPIYDEDNKILGYKSMQKLPIKREINLNFSRNLVFSPIISPLSFFSNMVLLEGVRGCIYQCRFCLAGYFYRPSRKLDLKSAVLEVYKNFSFDFRIGLILPSIDKSISWKEIKEIIKENELLISFSSLRLDQLDDEILDILFQSKQKTLTLAPEVGTNRLRRVINKNFTNDDILNFFNKIRSFPFNNLKLYFMCGLPTETQEDIEEMIKLVKEIKSILRKKHVTISLSFFVPKPHTPFQWEKMFKEEYFEKQSRHIIKNLKEIVNVQTEDIHLSLIQGLLSRGDRRIFKIFRYNISLKKLTRMLDWEKDFFLFREREKYEFFPWDIIDIGVKKEYLWREREKAYRGEVTDPCFEGCKVCGIC